MERDEDGVVLGSTRLPGSQWLHRKGDATREAGSLVGPMTAADSPSAISVFRINNGQSADAANQAAPPLGKVTSFSRIGRGKKKPPQPSWTALNLDDSRFWGE